MNNLYVVSMYANNINGITSFSGAKLTIAESEEEAYSSSIKLLEKYKPYSYGWYNHSVIIAQQSNEMIDNIKKYVINQEKIEGDVL